MPSSNCSKSRTFLNANVDLRWRAYASTRDYLGLDEMTDSHRDYINHLFGFKRWTDFADAQATNPAINRLLEAICGEHGYAVFRAMEAQMEEKTGTKKAGKNGTG